MQTSYLPLLRRLAFADPPLFLFGGVAEDALLDQTLSRPHNDVDVLVRRSELPFRLRQYADLGFPALETRYEPIRGRPLAVGATADGFSIEFGIVDEDEAGFYFIAGDQRGQLYRVRLTDGVFDYPPSTIDDVLVHVVAPLALHQMRAAFAALETFGEVRSRDTEAQERLRAMFFPADDEAGLAPVVEAL